MTSLPERWERRQDELVILYCTGSITPEDQRKLDILTRLSQPPPGTFYTSRDEWRDKQRYRKAMAKLHAYRQLYEKTTKELKKHL